MHEMFLPMNKNVKVLLNMFDLVINQGQDRMAWLQFILCTLNLLVLLLRISLFDVVMSSCILDCNTNTLKAAKPQGRIR